LTPVAALHRLLIVPERFNTGDTQNNKNIQIHFVGTKIIRLNIIPKNERTNERKDMTIHSQEKNQ